MGLNCFGGFFTARGILVVLAQGDVAMRFAVARFERGWFDWVKDIFMFSGSEVCVKISVLPGEVSGVWVGSVKNRSHPFRVWNMTFLNFRRCELGPDAGGSLPRDWLGEVNLLAAY